jgi:hypothetical protein
LVHRLTLAQPAHIRLRAAAHFVAAVAHLRAVLQDEPGVPPDHRRILAVGDAGTALRRMDGGEWVAEATGVSEDLHAVVALPEGPGDARAAHVVVGAHGVALLRRSDGTWSQEASGTQRDLHALFRRGTTTVAAGAGGVMLERSHQGSWRAIETYTDTDLVAIGPCAQHVCAVGKNGTLVDCAVRRERLACVPRVIAAAATARTIADDGELVGARVAAADRTRARRRMVPPT